MAGAQRYPGPPRRPTPLDTGSPENFLPDLLAENLVACSSSYTKPQLSFCSSQPTAFQDTRAHPRGSADAKACHEHCLQPTSHNGLETRVTRVPRLRPATRSWPIVEGPTLPAKHPHRTPVQAQ